MSLISRNKEYKIIKTVFPISGKDNSFSDEINEFSNSLIENIRTREETFELQT